MKDYNINPLITEYIHWIESEKELSNNSITSYQTDLSIFNKYIQSRNINITEVTKQHIEDFKKYMKDDKDWASSTRARRIISVRNFYKYLEENHPRYYDPTVKVEIPLIKKRNPVYLTPKQATRLVNVTNTQSEPYKSRDKLILMIFLTTGLRVEELTNIKLDDIQETTLHLIGKGKKPRIVGLNEDVMDALKDYLKIRNKVSPYLFISSRNTQMSKRTVQYTVDKYLQLAKLDKNKYSTHKLRHTAATLMLKGGADIREIQAVLGHTSIQTTELYTHIDSDQIQKTANITNGMFK